MSERRESSPLSDLLTPTNLIIGASAVAVVGIGAAIILSSRGGGDSHKKKKKGQVKKKKQELKSKYEDEEVPVRHARKEQQSRLSEQPRFSTEVEDDEGETPGAPLPRGKSSAKPASSRPMLPKPTIPTSKPSAAAAAAPAATKPAAKAKAAPVTAAQKATESVGVIQPVDASSARNWLRTWPTHQKTEYLADAITALGDALAEKQKNLAEDDIEGDLELTFDRWFLTGFLAAVISVYPEPALEAVVKVLRSTPAEVADDLDTPGICFHALILSHQPAALNLAFRLWLGQLPEETQQNLDEKEAETQFDNFLEEFQGSASSYAVLILFGEFHGRASEQTAPLESAMKVFDQFIETSENEEAKDELFKGTKYAFQRFGYYNPAAQAWLLQYAEKSKDEFVRNCIGEAFSAELAQPQTD